MKFKDISGQIFGHLTALYKLNNYHKKGVYWLCVCECGNLTEVNGKDLRKGNTKSCGCFRGRYPRNKPSISYSNNKPTRLYRIYHNMKSRCYNKNFHKYKNYGARGVTICDEWKDDFQAFYDWAISNGYKDNLTIDRIDVNGNYEPNNCRWATNKQQSRNTTKNVYLTYNGKTQIMKDWADELNINYCTLLTRHHRGWSDEECLFGKE